MKTIQIQKYCGLHREVTVIPWLLISSNNKTNLNQTRKKWLLQLEPNFNQFPTACWLSPRFSSPDLVMYKFCSPDENLLWPGDSLIFLSWTDEVHALLTLTTTSQSSLACGLPHLTFFPLLSWSTYSTCLDKNHPWPVDSFLFLPKSQWAHLHVVGMLRFVSFDTNQPSLPTPF